MPEMYKIINGEITARKSSNGQRDRGEESGNRQRDHGKGVRKWTKKTMYQTQGSAELSR